MIRFEHPEFIYLFLILPLALTGFAGLQRWRRNAIRRMGDEQVVLRLFPAVRSSLPWIRVGLWTTGLGFLILALLNPQWGNRRQTITMNSAEVVIALDISQSLYCRDVQPNRLEIAKSFALDALKSLKGHRVGLIFFAGQANLEVPLTDDYELLRELILIADPNMASQQGTSLGSAIRLAMEVLVKDARSTKGLLIISDGETHDENALSMAKQAAKNGIQIWTAGVGTKEGALIPIEVFGNQDYKRDETGNPVKTALNEKILIDLANISQGIYWNINRLPNAEAAVAQQLAGLDTSRSGQEVFDQQESRFQYALAIGMILLVVETAFPLLRRMRKNKMIQNSTS